MIQLLDSEARPTSSADGGREVNKNTNISREESHPCDHHVGMTTAP